MPKRSQKIVRLALERDIVCQWCGATGDLEVHHIIPVSEGGPDTVNDVTVLCDWCHHEIHWPPNDVRTEEEWHWFWHSQWIDAALQDYSLPAAYFFQRDEWFTQGRICGLCGEGVESLQAHRVECKARVYREWHEEAYPWQLPLRQVLRCVVAQATEGRNVDVTRSAAEQEAR